MTLRSLREIDSEISRGATMLWLLNKAVSLHHIDAMTFASIRFHLARGDFARANKVKPKVTHATFPFPEPVDGTPVDGLRQSNADG